MGLFEERFDCRLDDGFCAKEGLHVGVRAVRGHGRSVLTESSISEGLCDRIMDNGLIKKRGIRGILTLLLHVNKHIPNLNKPFIFPIQLLLMQQLHFLHITKSTFKLIF